MSPSKVALQLTRGPEATSSIDITKNELMEVK